MRRVLFLLIIGSFGMLGSSAAESGLTFGAYYTKMSKGESWETFSRTGKYADVVVQLPSGKLIFWRGTSYLPYWKTEQGEWSLPEIIPRSGDGVEPMPDRENVYSHVAIIQNTSSAVVVHWRYLASFAPGNPNQNVALDHFVDELFTITPDGKVDRVIKQCTDKIDDWKDPLNQTTETLQLKKEGVAEVSRIAPKHSPIVEKVEAGLQSKKPIVQPIVWLKFDEGAGSNATESVTGTLLPITGPKVLWKQGVSGTALEFDGYRSSVVMPLARAPAVSGGSITLEGWVALGAYPWNWAPIIQQGDNQGYFLGVDSDGYPGFMVKVDGVWQQLFVPNAQPYKDTNHMECFHWYHVAGSYNKSDGMMRLFLDGREVAAKRVGTGGVETSKDDIRIGKAGILTKPTGGTHDTKPSDFGLDALLDEVKVYNVAFDGKQASQSYQEFNPGQKVITSPDMQKRHFPIVEAKDFGGLYTQLPYYETWDNLWSVGPYSDIVVGFDESPIKVVFWRGMSYIPMLVNESQQWFTNEFNEVGFNKDAPGDCEPMSDKACFDSHVRLVENTPTRVVVHWRYRLANPDHYWGYYDSNTGWGDIADWYLTIYPDGVVCKSMHCYSSRLERWHEWDEQIVVFSEGQHPESVIKKTPVMTLVDTNGNSVDYDWNPNPPQPKYPGSIIQMIHLTGRYSPFSVQKFDKGDIYRGERTWYSVFPSWNHWPTSQIDSSGRNASFPDRASHSSISHLYWPYRSQEKGSAPFQEKVLLEGMSDQPAASLVPLAKSWLNPPDVTKLVGATTEPYDQSQRAYPFQYAGAPFAFTIKATPDRPIQNLCFEIKHWASRTTHVSLQVNGASQSEGPNFRQGVNIDPDGTLTLLVWVGLSVQSPQTFRLAAAPTQ